MQSASVCVGVRSDGVWHAHTHKPTNTAANLELPPKVAAALFSRGNGTSAEISARRAPKKGSKSSDAAQGAATNSSFADTAAEPECSFIWLMPSAERMAACVCLMASVFLLRNLSYCCIKYAFKATPSGMFWFPGPSLSVCVLDHCQSVYLFSVCMPTPPSLSVYPSLPPYLPRVYALPSLCDPSCSESKPKRRS